MLILIRGAGDLASGVALRLHRSGLKVVMTDLERPTAIRRTVCFSQAILFGKAKVEDVTAVRAETMDDVRRILAAGNIPVLKQHGAGQASLLALAGCVGLLLTAMTVLTPVMTFLRRLASLAGVNPALLAPVLKAAAVGLLTQLTESFCKDAGQQALAKAVELGGGVLALYALLPLASSVAELLQRMAGGG